MVIVVCEVISMFKKATIQYICLCHADLYTLVGLPCLKTEKPDRPDSSVGHLGNKAEIPTFLRIMCRLNKAI